MFRKYWISAIGIGLAAASVEALADHDRGSYGYDNRDDRYAEYDYARVVDVEPLRRRVRVSEPVRECWDEEVYASSGPLSSNHIGSTLVGALIGGALGNQVGDGRGRQVARAAGAIIGGAVGHNVSRERHGERYGNERRYQERCEVRYRDSYEERIEGYEVTYVYAGRRYMTEMPYDPGDRIRIRVDVTPTGG
jgi:uncharacterized protein YcfJ